MPGEVRDHARKHQWRRGPVRNAVGAQVVQAYSQKIKKQPGHWLLMIMRWMGGYGESVALVQGQG